VSARASRGPLRVAIVGLGPKGLYALERLTAFAGSEALAVDIYEPHPTPGAGPVYDPAQPAYLRMNFVAEMVDMWPTCESDPARPSFSGWRTANAPDNTEAYPPRALVGRYLVDGFERVLERAGSATRTERRAEAVASILSKGDGWEVAAAEPRAYDEVLVATGHANAWDGALSRTATASDNLVPAVFPVERCLSPDRVAAGSVVAVRGFALTMIDATLALTEGRGGHFEPGRKPYLLRYESASEEVATVLPYSRTGRPMLAKPDPENAIASPELDRIAARGRARLEALPEGSPLGAAVEVVTDVASKSLHSTGAAADASGDIARRLADALAGRATSTAATPAEEIERSIAVGAGAAAPGVDWAIGHAWRAVYPALVTRLGAGGLREDEWPAFRRLATEMERLAFGPPPVNAAKLLALIECGKVDLSHLDDGPAPGADLVVDAVIPPPGAAGLGQPLLKQIVRDGHARIAAGRRGLELTADVTCVGADGTPSHGLAAIGRPTEDWVIGNDTLNRALHPQPELWARRVAERARAG
jgi:diaminopimelate decarboxylase